MKVYDILSSSSSSSLSEVMSMAEFILQMSYPSRRIIRQTDNSSKYKSNDEFCSIICPDLLRGKWPRETGNIAKI